MKGAVVINGYLDGISFREPADMLVAAGARQDMPIEVFTNSELISPIGDTDALSERLGEQDFILFWDKDVRLAKNLEVCGFPVINCSEAIRICDDKSLTHLVLADYGIPSIRTVAGPMTFGKSFEDAAEGIADQIGFPMVVKDCFGSFGEQVRLVKDMAGLLRESMDGTPKIFQEFIDCGCKDIRIEVIGERAVAAVTRTAPAGDFRANASNGGTMERYTPTQEESQLAVDAAAVVQADFAGVDILQTKDGPVVCEVNSNAHIKNLLNATGIDVSDLMIGYVKGLMQ